MTSYPCRAGERKKTDPVRDEEESLSDASHRRGWSVSLIRDGTGINPELRGGGVLGRFTGGRFSSDGVRERGRRKKEPYAPDAFDLQAVPPTGEVGLPE